MQAGTGANGREGQAWGGELFDLTRDPDELGNVYADPAQRETVDKLKAELKRLREELKDADQFANRLPKDEV